MRSIEEVYDELLNSEELKQELAEAAINDTLEAFFLSLGCEADMNDIRAHFKRRIESGSRLTEEQLEDVRGGTDDSQAFRRMLVAWIESL